MCPEVRAGVSPLPQRREDGASLLSPSDSPFSPSWQPLPPDHEGYRGVQSWPLPISGPPGKPKARSTPKESEPGAHIWQERAHGLREVNASALGLASVAEARIRAAYDGYRTTSIAYDGLRTESTIEYWKTHKDPKRITPLVQPADLYRHKPPSCIKFTFFDRDWAAEEDSHPALDDEADDDDLPPYYADLDDRALWERQYGIDAEEIEQELSKRQAQEAREINPADMCRRCKKQPAAASGEYCDDCLCVDCPSDDRQPIKYIKTRLCTRCNEYRRTHKGQPRPKDTQRGRKKVYDQLGSG